VHAANVITLKQCWHAVTCFAAACLCIERCRWRELKLLPLLGRQSSTSCPPAKRPKLDTCQNPVYFTSGDESDMQPSADSGDVGERAEAGSQDTDSEVRRILPLHCDPGTVGKLIVERKGV